MYQRRGPPSKLRVLLDSRGVKATWLADQLGMSRAQFGHFDSGRRPAPAGFYTRAAGLLGVPEAWIRPDEPAKVGAA